MAVDVTQRAPAGTGTRSLRNALPALATVAAIGVAVRLLRPERLPWAQNFLIVFGGLLVEALPFVLLGALVSALIEVFVPSSAFERLARLPRPVQLPAAALAGFAFPVCECGSVPVARRLAVKGLSPSAAVTFMLAAPILNPVVVASTAIAYGGRDTFWTMLLGRIGLGFLVAVAVGWVVGSRTAAELLRPRPEDQVQPVELGRPEARWSRFVGHLAGDFFFMGKFVVLGATAAGVMQTFVPQSIIDGVAKTPGVDLLALMGLAFLLSLCSESDAFVAASFVQFGPSAQLAFLVFGPMVDLKLGALYMGTFSRGFTKTLVIAVAATTLVGTMWIRVIAG